MIPAVGWSHSSVPWGQWVVLAGYQRVEIPPLYRGRVVNIHPALLPAFAGRGCTGTACIVP